MTAKAIFPKVAIDMFFVQMKWTGWFLAIMILIQIAKTAFLAFSGNDLDSFFVSVSVASNIFMLVIGILAGIFFPWYFVRHGVTRKDYFLGTVTAAVSMAAIIPVIVKFISLIEQFILKIILAVEVKPFKSDLFDPDEFEPLGDIIEMIIVSPMVDPQSNLLLAVFLFSINILMCYAVGFLIGCGFFRFGYGGFLYIALGIVFTAAYDLVLILGLGQALPGTFAQLLSNVDLSLMQAIAGVLALIALAMWLIRQTTKRLVIKV